MLDPVRVSGLVVMSVGALFLIFLLILAMIRVCKAPVQVPTEEEWIGVDVLVSEPLPKLTVEAISHDQSIVLVSGMTILVSRQTDEDGLYFVDESKDIIRVNSIQANHGYKINVGKHHGLRFYPSMQEPVHAMVRHVLRCDMSLSPSDHCTHMILFCMEGVGRVTINTTSQTSLLLSVHYFGTNSLCVSVGKSEDIIMHSGCQDWAIVEGIIQYPTCKSILMES